MAFFGPHRKRKPSVRATWTRLEKWYAKQLPAAHKSLNRGASKRQIAELEKATRRTLPDDLKESLLIHNGQSQVVEGVVFGLRLLPIDRILSDWEIVRAVHDDGASSKRTKSLPKNAVQCCENHPGWMPLTDDSSGGHIGIDLAPGAEGTWGQVINFGKSEYAHYAISHSWGDFLADIADELTSGNYRIQVHDDETCEFNIAKPTTGHFCDALAGLYRKRPKAG